MNVFRTQHIASSIILILLILILSFSIQAGSDYDGAVPPSLKAFYDVNISDPANMPVFLGVIRDTYDLLIDNGTPAEKSLSYH